MLTRPSSSLWWKVQTSSSIHTRCGQRCRRYTASTSSQHGSTFSLPSSNTGSFPLVQSQPRQLKLNSSSLIPSLACLRLKTGYVTHTRKGQVRSASTSSNTRWLSRQKGDRFAREAKVNDLRSRAAFKLLQINDRYRIFKPGQTVVDLGFAPGSWSQVAIDLVRPGVGRVVGVDIIPVAPPRGVNGLQGDFLSPETQERVRSLLRDESAGRARTGPLLSAANAEESKVLPDQDEAATGIETGMEQLKIAAINDKERAQQERNADSEHSDKVVDVVLSDMSAPWEIFSGLWKNSLSNPYYRMMNTSGNKFKDHAGSMDLCRSALYFAHDTLKVGGYFVCKFYQGGEDKAFERQMKAMFQKVHREKPESSRSESKESFFVGIKRLAKVDRIAVFDEGN